MPRLFSYVVEHDEGRSPNPFGGYCTLAHCKFSSDGKHPNVTELAEVGDWVVGTGGRSARSAGHGRLVYAMKVTEKLTLEDYGNDQRFRRREDNRPADAHRTDRFALVSRIFYYFGANAVKIPRAFIEHPLEKRGPGFRYRNFDATFIAAFENWLSTRKRGRQGNPVCGVPTGQRLPRVCG